jgi:hypothetical protein
VSVVPRLRPTVQPDLGCASRIFEVRDGGAVDPYGVLLLNLAAARRRWSRGVREPDGARLVFHHLDRLGPSCSRDAVYRISSRRRRRRDYTTASSDNSTIQQR